jgi:hypothetical protein
LMIRASTPAMTMPFIHFRRSICARITASSCRGGRCPHGRGRSGPVCLGSCPVCCSMRSRRSWPTTRLAAAARAFCSGGASLLQRVMQFDEHRAHRASPERNLGLECRFEQGMRGGGPCGQFQGPMPPCSGPGDARAGRLSPGGGRWS